MTPEVDRNRSLAFAAFIAAAMGAVSLIPGGQTLAALLCAACALLSTPAAIGSVFGILILRTGNPELIGEPADSFELIVWGALMLAAGRIVLDMLISRRPLWTVLPPSLFIYAAVLVPLSLFFSEAPMLSLTKATSFFVSLFAITIGFAIMRSEERPASSWIKGLWLAVIFLSLPTLLMPAIGYARDGQGFQGILYHPQGFAVFLAPVVIWSLVVALSGNARGRALAVAVFVLAFACLWLTRGRTGFAAILLSVVGLLLFRPGFSRQLFVLAGTALQRPWVLLALTLLAPIMIWKAPVIAQAVQDFLFKEANSGDLSGAFEASRGFIVDQQILNFQSSPWVGIGFGVSNSTTHALQVAVDPMTGLPVGAATEKANLALAVLEETGVVGTLAFVPFFFALVYRLARTRSLPLAWASLAALSTNISEMTFFSFGGIGLYTWLIMAWALSEYVPAPRKLRTSVPGYSGATPLAGARLARYSAQGGGS